MSDNDLIRRGDALKAFDWGDIYGRNAQDAINAIPAVQPTVSPELLATTNEELALQLLATQGQAAEATEAAEAKLAKAVEALEQAKDFIDDQYACAESQAVQGEYVAKDARQLWYMLCAALARVKGETK